MVTQPILTYLYTWIHESMSGKRVNGVHRWHYTLAEYGIFMYVIHVPLFISFIVIVVDIVAVVVDIKFRGSARLDCLQSQSYNWRYQISLYQFPLSIFRMQYMSIVDTHLNVQGSLSILPRFIWNLKTATNANLSLIDIRYVPLWMISENMNRQHLHLPQMPKKQQVCWCVFWKYYFNCTLLFNQP